MTFNIINYVTKFEKSESGQFSERAYVRRALSEITGTIQSAKDIFQPDLKFGMPTGEIIEYKLSDKNVNKVVDGTPYRLMESVDEFRITEINNRLFNIHIKTSKEGKVYDFKVDKRRNITLKSDAVISSISPTSEVFDKNIHQQQDIDITLYLNGNEFIDLRNGGDILTLDTDYSVSGSGDVVTIKREYLKKQLVGTIEIIFDVNIGLDPVLTVEIKDTSSQIKIEGNSLTDDLVRMNFPGNLDIDPGDNKWTLTVTNGTVAEDINIDDLVVSGLPQGINAEAAKLEGENKIVVTLSGTVSTPITSVKPIGIIIKNSGVDETSALNSEPIKVFILPGSASPSPERNLMYTNKINKSGRVTITGDVVIGDGKSDINMNDRTDIYGYVYIDGKLNVNERFIVGKEDKPVKVFVKGSANFNSNTTINGDLYYSNQLQQESNLTVTGVKEHRPVEIPPLTIPELKSKQWYINNGYTVVNSYWPKVELVDNGKYYYEIDYSFDNPIKGLQDVTIVGKGNIGFNAKFEGSGILFAPNGTISSSGSFNFTGMCISNCTTLNNGGTLTFKRYAELPFDESYQ
ncbi:MAG TPA: X2-like carbohydrate binding domain-containing protein [Clostridia bacterium]|nr:X2-like carbohydrate binding domain-containing protein [Clostridia bacterium]